MANGGPASPWGHCVVIELAQFIEGKGTSWVGYSISHQFRGGERSEDPLCPLSLEDCRGISWLKVETIPSTPSTYHLCFPSSPLLPREEQMARPTVPHNDRSLPVERRARDKQRIRGFPETW